MVELINILAIGLASCILLPTVLVAVLIGFSVFNGHKEKEKDAGTEK